MKDRYIFTTILVLLASFAVSQSARAVSLDYESGNTAQSGVALFSVTNGSHNVLVGFDGLYNDITGGSNTTIYVAALSRYNTTDKTLPLVSLRTIWREPENRQAIQPDCGRGRS